MNSTVVLHLWRVNHVDGDPNEPMGFYWAESSERAMELASHYGPVPPGGQDNFRVKRERNGDLYERAGTNDPGFSHGPLDRWHTVEGLPRIAEFFLDESTRGGLTRGDVGPAEHGLRRFAVEDREGRYETLSLAVLAAVGARYGVGECDVLAAGRVLGLPEAIGPIR